MIYPTVPATNQFLAVAEGHKQDKPLAAFPSNGIREQGGLNYARYLTQL